MRLLCLILLVLAPLSSAGADYVPVSLASVANTDVSGTIPTGNVTLGNVPFAISSVGPNVFVTESAGYDVGKPRYARFDMNIERPTFLHILIGGVSVYNSFSGQLIGSIDTFNSSGSATISHLMAGVNIRDWVAVPGVITTTTSPNVNVVWSGMNGPFDAAITKMTIPLASNGSLRRIELFDFSQPTELEGDPTPKTFTTSIAGDVAPGIIVFGMTVETEPVPEPSGLLALAGGIIPLGIAYRRRRR